MCEIACVVLCGGRSSRMGRDKAFLPFGDGDLVHFVYERCKGVFAQTFLCFKNTQPHIDIPTISESQGINPTHAQDKALFSPLYGIVCAFKEIESAYIAFVSVDTPFVKPKSLYALYEKVRDSHTNGGYIVQIDEVGVAVREHFLLSVWHKNTLDSLTYAIRTQNFRVRNLVKELGFITYAVCDEDLDYNLNTQQDYQCALRHLENLNALNPDSKS